MPTTVIYRNPQITLVATEEDRKKCDEVRVKVFVDEIGVDLSYFIKDHVEDAIGTVWLVTCERIADGSRVPVGTIRLLPIENMDTAAELTRLAVLSDARGLKLGQKLVKVFEEGAKSQGKTAVMLEARYGAHGFYQSLGYVIEENDKEIFIKNGIPHVRLWKREL